ncbi:MAG: BMP family protein [Candidatus Tectomicrobia bacterium]|uniref:BMP family protein n=1 Tax=Tectimicrobiota bacterium TaxID=2528274 RepID=A0A932HW08_UNCTE|nr:BMP family protein [Candidatus Tectomicrobia bacterium]
MKTARLAFLAGLCLAAGLAALPGGVWAAPHKFAMIVPGPIEDSDFNFRGYEVVEDVKKHYKMPASLSERISPADAERVAREYIASGHTIVAFHGGQYFSLVRKLSPAFPKTVLVIESSAPGTFGKNVWNVHRKFNEGFYAFGALAGLSTKTNNIGVIAGIQLPDFRASINSISDALKQVNPKAKLVYSFTGDQNDPIKARQTAEAMMANKVDFIINMVNLGVYGVIEAAKASKNKVLVTTFYTDKTEKAPDHLAGTLILDFRPPYRKVVDGILKGQTSGYVAMQPGNGFELAGIRNVPPQAAAKTKEFFEKVQRGEIKVRNELTKIDMAK